MNLEKTIADLVERKRAALVDSADWTLVNNALIALRYSCADAGDIIEDLEHRKLVLLIAALSLGSHDRWGNENVCAPCHFP